MARPRDKGRQREIAAERIRVLFGQAMELARKGDVASASQRVRLAHKVALKCNVRITREFRHIYCRRCYTFLTSANSRRRLNPRQHRVELKCLGCGYTSHLPYVREKKSKK